MAVQAGRDCLIGVDRGTVVGVALASTTLPFADRLNASVCKAALNLSDDVAALDTPGSQRTVDLLTLAARANDGRMIMQAEGRLAT